MARKKLKNKNTRKISRIGPRSLGLTLPVEFLIKLKWREGQKVVVSKKGRHLIIKDWKK